MKNLLLRATFSITIVALLMGSIAIQPVFAQISCEDPEDCGVASVCLQFDCQDGECIEFIINEGGQCGNGDGACLIDACQNGLCLPQPLPDTTPCGVSTDCSENICLGGTCELSVTACDQDADECTIASCDPNIGCIVEPNPVCEEESPVAGELLPLDTSALMIAGLTTSAVWMIPAIAGLAGVGVYLVKHRANRD